MMRLFAVAVLWLAAFQAVAQINPFDLIPREIKTDSFEARSQALLGAWAMTSQLAGTIGTVDFLLLDGETYTGSNGRVYLVAGWAFWNDGLGLADLTDQGDWLLLTDDDSGYYGLYRFTDGKELNGRYWLYQKGASPTGAGSWMRGFRIADIAQVQALLGNGAAVSGASEKSARMDRLWGAGSDPAPKELLDRLPAMIHDLEAMRAKRGR